MEPPKRRKLISCKWVFQKNKAIFKKDGEKYKVRLVAKGYAEREGKDYNKIFLQVVKHTSIRVILALVVIYDL